MTPQLNVSVTHTKDDRFSHPDNIPIIDNCVQTPDTLVYDQGCHKERKVTAKVKNNLTNYSNKCVQMKHGPFLRPFEIYVLCDTLKTGIGNALVDTGSQVALITERSLIKGSNIKRHVFKIYGITGDYLETKGQVDLSLGT